jgi:hypothetical protein
MDLVSPFTKINLAEVIPNLEQQKRVHELLLFLKKELSELRKYLQADLAGK